MTELSQGQQYAFDKFQCGDNLFVSGPGGSGKSHLIKYFVNHLYTKGTIHQVTSTTGCSSILLSNSVRIGGRPIIVKTIHSWSGIRLGKVSKDEIVNMVMKNKRIVREWRRVKTLIIDEISMFSYKLFEVLEEIARKTKNNDRPFGGIQLVCLGDFFQLPPVGDYNDPETSAFCFESPTWRRVFPIENHVELTTIYRQLDPIYQRILNEVRIGKLSEESNQELQKRVGLTYDPANHGGVIPMKIFATKNQVNIVNRSQYEKIQEKEQKYDTVIKTNNKRYIETGEEIDDDILEFCQQLSMREIEYETNTMTNNMPCELEVCLKKGNPVMCLVNLDVESGIANGSVGVIEDFVMMMADGSPHSTKENVPLVRFANGIVKMIGKYTWQSSEYPTITASQIPLCLAYSNSIHKMQGATLDVCEMNLGGSVFAEHQTYVALSRVKSLDGVYLSAFHPQRIRVNPKVVNFYKQFPPLPEKLVEESRAELDDNVFEKSLSKFICPNSSGDLRSPSSEHRRCSRVETPQRGGSLTELVVRRLSALLPEDSSKPPCRVVRGAESLSTTNLYGHLGNRISLDENHTQENDKECPICLEDMEKPYITNCNHKYCLECITRLINSSYTKTSSCPLCRQDITLRTIRSVGPEKKKGAISRLFNKKPKGLMITQVDL
jgi:ATP-dependent DNA helicase PIF1